ncbi:MAG: YciI family protein [Ignavibacteriae bacterium]|nr:YciI family protein [Ignavibacteriota bacterium]
MMFIKHCEDYGKLTVPSSLYEAMGAFIEKAHNDGTYIDGAGLQPMSAGHRIRLSGGKITVTDGPFTETKEIIGGYALIEVKSEAEALEIANQFMDLHRVHWPRHECECEVRPLQMSANLKVGRREKNEGRNDD